MDASDRGFEPITTPAQVVDSFTAATLRGVPVSLTATRKMGASSTRPGKI